MRKELFENYFKNKNITIMGLGVLGRGLGDAKFMIKYGANLTITDKKDERALADSIKDLGTKGVLSYTLGRHEFYDFENKDFIYKASSVPLDSQYILHANKNNVPVYMSSALLTSIVHSELPNVTTIGVTGTRGKSTVANMLHQILLANGKKVHIGGNVRGVATLPILEQIEDGDYLLMELDSWQLQGFGDMKISPRVSVFTTFMDDHMNYYKGDKLAYFKDKANIFINQKKGDVCVMSKEVKEKADEFGYKNSCAAPESLVEVSLLGTHNRELAGIAFEASRRLGLNENISRLSLLNIKPVEGRLEYMGTVNGIHFVNDNNATTPDATVVGIKACVDKWGVKPVLITGGADKGLDYGMLLEVIKNNVSNVVFLAGTGTERYKGESKEVFATLKECVERAMALVNNGDVILFSPACASFSSYFRNEYERNDEFVRLIKSYSGFVE